MPVTNINGIENLEDIKHLTAMSDQQLVQALANLGQRMGIKGDSVEYGSFSFLDLLDNNYIQNSENKKEIGILNYYLHPDKNCVFAEIGTTSTDERYVHDKTVLWNNINNEENVFNQQFFINNFKLETLVNNIEWYNSNSIINRDGNILKTLLFGKILGMDVDEQNNLEIQYNEFNLATNTLERGIRTYYVYSTSINEQYYILLDFQLVNTQNAKDNDWKQYYKLDVYVLNSNDVYNDIGLDIKSLYNYSRINTNEDFENISDNYINIFNKKYFNEYALFNLFFNTNYSSKYNNNKIKFNIEENKLLADESDDQLKYIETILVNSSEISIYNRIEYINNDITYLYPQILAFYDQHAYKDSKGIMYRHILYSLYEKLLKEYNIDDSYIDEFPTLYIPLNQKIFYLHNKANEFIIYFTNDIHVNNIDLSIYTQSKIQDILNSDTFVFDYSCVKNNDVSKTYENRQSIYHIYFDYNTKYEHIVNNISVLDVYTLPYINIKNHWVVNGLDTTVVAKAQVENDQTILIVVNEYDESTDSIKLRVVSAINNFDTFNSAVTNIKLNVKIDNSTYLEYNLPQLNEDNYTYFNDILIILISDSKCLYEYSENEKVRDKSSNKMCTFWQASISDNNEYCFKILKFDDDNILNGKDIFNIDDIKRWLEKETDINNNKFDNVIFNINSTISYTQDVISSSTTNDYKSNWGFIEPDTYLNLQKSIHTTDTDAKAIGDQNYYNNMVFLFGTYNSSGIVTYNNDIKFITMSQGNNVTNCLAYGKSNREEIDRNTILSSEDRNTLIQNITIATFKDVAQVIFSQDLSGNYPATKLADILERQYSLYEEQEIIEKINNSSTQNETIGFYNDYDFNFNVPEFDFKEFITKNINVLNRVNILGLDSKGNIYNGFLGIDIDKDDEDSAELLLTTSKKNINIGTNTLMSYDTSVNLNKFSALRILFPEIIFDSVDVVFKTNAEKYEQISSSIYKAEQKEISHSFITSPETIVLNSFIEPYMFISGNSESEEIIPKLNLAYMFKGNISEDTQALTKMFYVLADENKIYNFENKTINEKNKPDKVLFNISSVLRKYGIMNKKTKINKIYYNNVLVPNGPVLYNSETHDPYDLFETYQDWYGSDDYDKYLLIPSFKYESDGKECVANQLLFDVKTTNTNIFMMIDKSHFVGMKGRTKKNKDNSYSFEGDSLFIEGEGTIILNYELRVTYWKESSNDDCEHLTLVINDSGLADTSQDVKIMFERPSQSEL